jgi:forkhead box protein J2/3
MLGMRYPPMPLPLLTPEESLPVDEHGNIDWRMTWVNELAALQRHTAEQDKANVPADWYRSMFYRLRFGMMGPYNPEDIPPQATVTHAITQDHPDQTQE